MKLLKPFVSPREVELVTGVLESCWWGEGPVVAHFENMLSEIYDKYCVAVNSCTAALHLSLMALNIGPGDEVILPALTFISTALAVLYCGAKPVFADVYGDSLCIDWREVELLINKNTKAIICVDYAGYPSFKYRFDIPIIQDAAHSFGAPAMGDFTCFSFHPVKPVASGDGGAILVSDIATADRLRELRWCGISKSTYKRDASKYSWDYNVRELGYKYNWNDILAAVGVAQVESANERHELRQKIAARYNKHLSNFVQLPKTSPIHTWHLYPIRVPEQYRDKVIEFMTAREISVGVHYKPVTYYDVFKNSITPLVTEREWRKLISLPMYADLTYDDQIKVITTLEEALKWAIYTGSN